MGNQSAKIGRALDGLVERCVDGRWGLRGPDWSGAERAEGKPFDCYVCATAARLMYDLEAFQPTMERLIGRGNIARCKLLSGKLLPEDTVEVHQPMATLVYRRGGQNTMLVAWRGSTTPLDWTHNVAAAPVRSPMWQNEWPHIEVHGGWSSLANDVFSRYFDVQREDGEPSVLDLLTEHGITRVLLAGHSLGGALAQIVHLAAKAKLRQLARIRPDLMKIQLRAFTFAAPMPFHVRRPDLGRLTDSEQVVMNELMLSNFNFVFAFDLIPRLPGHTKWLRSAVRDIAQKGLGAAALVIPQSYIDDLQDLATSNIQALQGYTHLGTIFQADLEDDSDSTRFTGLTLQRLTPDEFCQQEYPFSEGGKRASINRGMSMLAAHLSLPRAASFEAWWSWIAPMGERRAGCAAAVLNGRLYALGGSDGSHTLSTAECFDPEEDAWTRIDPMGERREGCAAAVLNGRLYALGGEVGHPDDSQRVSTVERYDPEEDAWTRIAPMCERRSMCAAAVLNGRLYTLGGELGHPDDSQSLSTAERYDPEEDAWTRIAPMSERRSMCAAAVLNGRLYALGGWDGSQFLSTAERYDPEEDAWTRIAPMGERRWGCAAAVLNGRLYALGGWDGSQFLSTAERYDPEEDSWTWIAPMGERRGGCAVAVLNGRLYALGGWDGSQYLSTAERYGPEEADSWAPAASVGERQIGS